MPSTQVTLTGSTPVTVQLSAPTGSVNVTITAAAAEVVVTADGSYPTLPSNGVTNNTNAIVIPGVLGQSGIIQPPLFGNHMQIPSLNLASTGTPTVLIQW